MLSWIITNNRCVKPIMGLDHSSEYKITRTFNTIAAPSSSLIAIMITYALAAH